MIYHSPGTEYKPSNYKEFLACFIDKMSLDSYLFKGPQIEKLIKEALTNGHLQESAVDAGARQLLFITKSGKEYWQSIRYQSN